MEWSYQPQTLHNLVKCDSASIPKAAQMCDRQRRLSRCRIARPAVWRAMRSLALSISQRLNAKFRKYRYLIEYCLVNILSGINLIIYNPMI
ncbi:hypothetical protein DBY66_016380 [Pantoea sp. RIT413]|nr:hypothetical protein DBY66_016380 [Pantoea sp. RIT 413]